MKSKKSEKIKTSPELYLNGMDAPGPHLIGMFKFLHAPKSTAKPSKKTHKTHRLNKS